MTISYKWISEYIPVELDPERIAKILTSIGLEVESLTYYEADRLPGESPEQVPATGGSKSAAHASRHYTDWIYEIGLTPNRMDAMSHQGVARDLCAYLSHHEKKDFRPRFPATPGIRSKPGQTPIRIEIADPSACHRYCGALIRGIRIGPSPAWLQDRLRAIGVRPINNIVDITNYLLHDTGQPLHAFDAARSGTHLVVRRLAEGTAFTTLDGKSRNLSAEDLVICDGSGQPLALAGVFGGLDSGVTSETNDIFLESAWFSPVDVRRTSFRHGLRTEAAARFEKNVDISKTLTVLHQAVRMVLELAGGTLEGEISDQYPGEEPRREVVLRYHYLKKLSGKNYHPDTIRRILQSLGFEIIKEGMDDLRLAVPHSKPDISMPADVLEEIMRIDGYDNIDIPAAITISPATGGRPEGLVRREKAADYLVGQGFHEILTNSVTNSAYFSEEELQGSVRLLNNLSAVHNMLRTSMLETGLESVAYNLNRRNNCLRFFEFGKTYRSDKPGQYQERTHLCLYVTGAETLSAWKKQEINPDLYYMKGLVHALLHTMGIPALHWQEASNSRLRPGLAARYGGQLLAETGPVSRPLLDRFDIRQEVYFADIRWETVLSLAAEQRLAYTPLPTQPSVQRDLAIVVDRHLAYEAVETAIHKTRPPRLRQVGLFDVFESEKLGAGKKSFAISLTFQDEEKTLTDEETDSMMQQIMDALRQELGAEIRSGGKK